MSSYPPQAEEPQGGMQMKQTALLTTVLSQFNFTSFIYLNYILHIRFVTYINAFQVIDYPGYLVQGKAWRHTLQLSLASKLIPNCGSAPVVGKSL